MSKCERCGKEVVLPFTCNYCCPNQPQRIALGSIQSKQALATNSVNSDKDTYLSSTPREDSKPKKPSPMKKLIAIGVIAILLVPSLVFFAPKITSYLQNSNSSNDSYTKLTIHTLDIANYNLGYNSWNFRYTPASTSGGLSTSSLILIVDVAGNTNFFYDIYVGESITWDGIQFKVSEIYPAYVVLLVKPVF